MVKRQILEADRRMLAWHRTSKISQRLEAIPGVGPLIATALVASIPDPSVFRSGRDLSAWIGLVPKQNSTGGKERLGGISKAGNRYLRTLLVVGALSVIRRAKQLGYTRHPWLVRLMERRSVKIAAIALANKIARMAWAMMARNESYRTPLPHQHKAAEQTRGNSIPRNEVGKGNDRIMHPSQSARRSGQPTCAIAPTRARAFDRDPICGEHYGQRPCEVPHQQAEHMAAPTSRAISFKKPLPTRSRPHMALCRHGVRRGACPVLSGKQTLTGRLGVALERREQFSYLWRYTTAEANQTEEMPIDASPWTYCAVSSSSF